MELTKTNVNLAPLGEVFNAGEQTEAASFHVKASNMGFVMSLFSDKIYSDKIAAPIREYSTNAMDAHTESDQSRRPIEVEFPSPLNHTFRIRDFGRGLSFEDVAKIYVSYCESTKRDDMRTNGTLGIGSKSGFAYSDTFTVVSRHGGKRITYVAEKGEIGRAIKFHSEDMDEGEETGVEIRIAVKACDVSAFRSRACEIYRVFQVTPNVVNATDEERAEMAGESRGEVDMDPKFLRVVLGMKNPPLHVTRITRGNLTSCKIVMGNVAYTWSSGVGGCSLDRSVLSGVHIYVENGAVDFLPSREGLEMTQKTNRFLSQTLFQVKRIVKASEVWAKARKVKSFVDAEDFLFKGYSDLHDKNLGILARTFFSDFPDFTEVPKCPNTTTSGQTLAWRGVTLGKRVRGILSAGSLERSSKKLIRIRQIEDASSAPYWEEVGDGRFVSSFAGAEVLNIICEESGRIAAGKMRWLQENFVKKGVLVFVWSEHKGDAYTLRQMVKYFKSDSQEFKLMTMEECGSIKCERKAGSGESRYKHTYPILEVFMGKHRAETKITTLDLSGDLSNVFAMSSFAGGLAFRDSSKQVYENNVYSLLSFVFQTLPSGVRIFAGTKKQVQPLIKRGVKHLEELYPKGLVHAIEETPAFESWAKTRLVRGSSYNHLAALNRVKNMSATEASRFRSLVSKFGAEDSATFKLWDLCEGLIKESRAADFSNLEKVFEEVGWDLKSEHTSKFQLKYAEIIREGGLGSLILSTESGYGLAGALNAKAEEQVKGGADFLLTLCFLDKGQHSKILEKAS